MQSAYDENGPLRVPLPPPFPSPAEVSRRFVAGKGSSWQLAPPQIFAPETRSWADFPFDEDFSSILEDEGQKFTERKKKGTTYPVY